MDLPKRKPNRLPEYDYSTPGAYFITFCTKDRKNLFWENVGASSSLHYKITGRPLLRSPGLFTCIPPGMRRLAGRKGTSPGMPSAWRN